MTNLRLVGVWLGITDRQANRQRVFHQRQYLNQKNRQFITGWHGRAPTLRLDQKPPSRSSLKLAA